MTTLQPGAMLTDNFLLERELGHGGMGTVWVARNQALGSQVAVKVLNVGGAAGDETRVRFEHEARGLAQIDHPHVVKIFDYGITRNGEPFIVMELLRGEDLAQRLERVGPLPLADVLTIVGQACKALGRAHALGAVHRDIKPANLFLLEGDDLFVKVLDFGVARFAETGNHSMTRTGAMMGTPYYMSPEQLLDPRSVDLRTDLWAMAVVAYVCFTGQQPFDGETLTALSMAICSGRFAPPSSVRSDLPPSIDAWMSRALQSSAAGRYPDGRAFVEALAQACSAPASPGTFGQSALTTGGGYLPVAGSTQSHASAPTSGAPLSPAGVYGLTGGAGAFAMSVPQGPVSQGPVSQGPVSLRQAPYPQAPYLQAPYPQASSYGQAPYEPHGHVSNGQARAAEYALATSPAVRRRWPWLLVPVVAMGALSATWFGRSASSVADRGDERPSAARSPRAAASSASAGPTSTGGARPLATAAVDAPPREPAFPEPSGVIPRTPTPSSTAARPPPPSAPPASATSPTAAPATTAEPAPQPTRSTSAAHAGVMACWRGNSGAVAGTPASSVSVRISVSELGRAGSVAVTGPGRSDPGFVSCCVSKLTSMSYGPGPAETMSFPVALPAGPSP